MQITGEDISRLSQSYQAMQDFLNVLVEQAEQSDNRWVAAGGTPLWSVDNATALESLRAAVTAHQNELRENVFVI